MKKSIEYSKSRECVILNEVKDPTIVRFFALLRMTNYYVIE